MAFKASCLGPRFHGATADSMVAVCPESMCHMFKNVDNLLFPRRAVETQHTGALVASTPMSASSSFSILAKLFAEVSFHHILHIIKKRSRPALNVLTHAYPRGILICTFKGDVGWPSLPSPDESF